MIIRFTFLSEALKDYLLRNLNNDLAREKVNLQWIFPNLNY